MRKILSYFTRERLVWSGSLIITAITFYLIGMSFSPGPLQQTTQQYYAEHVTTTTTNSVTDLPDKTVIDVETSAVRSVTAVLSDEPSASETGITSKTAHQRTTVHATSTAPTTSTVVRAVVTTRKSSVVTNAATTVTDVVPKLINLNTATREELMTVKGIGEVISQRIIDYREIYGGFRSVDELIEVKGIGEKLLAKFAPYFTVDDE